MNNSEIIKQINELFEESILNLPDEDILKEIESNSEIDFKRHLKHIKKLNTQAKANLQRSTSEKAKEILNDLINQFGKSELLSRLLKQPKYQELNLQFFSKHEGISNFDRGSTLIDRKLMELIRELKEEIEDEEDTN